MALKFKKPTGEAFVNTTIIDNKAKINISEETIPLVVEPPEKVAALSSEPLAEVSVEFGYNKNMGNYQSARVTVGLRLPTPFAHVDDAFNFAHQWVNDKLEKALADLDASVE